MVNLCPTLLKYHLHSSPTKPAQEMYPAQPAQDRRWGGGGSPHRDVSKRTMQMEIFNQITLVQHFTKTTRTLSFFALVVVVVCGHQLAYHCTLKINGKTRLD